MDQLMIDFENVYPNEGDEVLFFGNVVMIRFPLKKLLKH